MNPLSSLWHDVILRFVHWLLAALQGVVGHRAGSLAIAIVLTTLVLSVALVPLNLLATRVARRNNAARAHRTLVEATAARVWAGDDEELRNALRQVRPSLPRAWPSWPLQVVVVLVQYLVVGALYFAVGDVARSVPAGDLSLGGIGDITKTTADVCCSAPGGGHTSLLSGLLDNPGALVLPLLAIALALAQQLLSRRRARPEMSVAERRELRAEQQTALASPLITLTMSLFLPVAVALVLVSQAAAGLVQALITRLLARRHPAPTTPRALPVPSAVAG